MKIALIGATDFAGKVLLKGLLASGYIVTAITIMYAVTDKEIMIWRA